MATAHTPHCTHAALARNEMGGVAVCSCGRVHLTIGPATLHLERDAFLRAAVMIDDAAAQLAAVGADDIDDIDTERVA